MAMAMASSVKRAFCLSASPISLLHSSPPSTAVVSFPFTATAAASTQLRRLCAARTGGYELEMGSQIRNPRWDELDDVPVDEDEVDWEDMILEETVPVIAFAKMILFSDSYEIGDELSPEHDRTIRERLLPYHPDIELKIGCGIDRIIVGTHSVYVRSRCLTIVRKDGTIADFSYWKCVREIIYKKFPLHAAKFIQKHFANRSLKMR